MRYPIDLCHAIKYMRSYIIGLLYYTTRIKLIIHTFIHSTETPIKELQQHIIWKSMSFSFLASTSLISATFRGLVHLLIIRNLGCHLLKSSSLMVEKISLWTLVCSSQELMGSFNNLVNHLVASPTKEMETT